MGSLINDTVIDGPTGPNDKRSAAQRTRPATREEIAEAEKKHRSGQLDNDGARPPRPPRDLRSERRAREATPATAPVPPQPKEPPRPSEPESEEASEWEQQRLKEMAEIEAGINGAAPEEPELIDREMACEVQYRNPDTGQHQTVTFVSKVPDSNAVTLIGAKTVAFLGGVAWTHAPEFTQWRALALATCYVQCSHVPDWFIRRLGEDPALLQAVYGRLNEHTARYFPRDESKGPKSKGRPRLVVGALAQVPVALRTRAS